MKKNQLLLLGLLSLTNFGFSQLDEFETTLDPMFSKPAEDGWMYFTTPNNYQPGECFQFYKTEKNDINNDMLLLGSHTDSLAYYKHYKFQQLYNGVPVEGAGCIEHYDTNGNLIFTNAKHAIDLNANVIPAYNQTNIINKLLIHLPNNNQYAWENPQWEQQIRTDLADSNATWYPTAKLILAIDEIRDMHGDIDGDRYTLAYEIPITTLAPEYSSKIYFVNATSGQIIKERSTSHNITANVYGYGVRNIDAQWNGGFVQKYRLKADNGNRNIHTKKFLSPTAIWSDMDETQSGLNDWGSLYETETSAHFHVTNTWDYFYYNFGRNGHDGAGTELRVITQVPLFNAFYDPTANPNSPNTLNFGYSGAYYSLGNEPSVVAHEYTHGVTYYTSALAYEFESGALNESFSDIFGIVIPAQTLDGGATDWIIGNFVPEDIQNTRSLINPNSRGVHWTGIYSALNDPIYDLSQPDDYNGTYYCDNCPFDVDKGGVHINSGVQNKWFQLLTEGQSAPTIQGVGMTKAAKIAYYALTSLLGSSSQYYDSKNATIQASILLYGECSIEHKSTVNAWNAVGIFASYSCTASINDIVNSMDVLVYPNPSNTILNIEFPVLVNSPIEITDVNGKLIKSIETNNIYCQTDVSNIADGVYFVNLDFNGQQVVKRIVIRK